MKIKKRSDLQERRVAADLGGKVQKASGATDFAKGDVRKFGDVRVECKTTGTKNYRLSIKDIKKIQSEALKGGMEDWVMQIEFQGQTGVNYKYAVMGYYSFIEAMKEPVIFVTYVAQKDSIALSLSDLISVQGQQKRTAHRLEFQNEYVVVIPWELYLTIRSKEGEDE